MDSSCGLRICGPTESDRRRCTTPGPGRHDKMVELLERMPDPSTGSGQALHKQLPKAKTPHEQESLNRTIEATDKQNDALVYGSMA